MHPYTQMFNWPNALTLIRILVVPLLIVLFYLPVPWAHPAAAALFAIASLTDWLDGYLARYLRQNTKIGEFLDPVADKLMVSLALVLIVAEPTFQSLQMAGTFITIPTALITVPAAIIVAREIIVSALREWMAEVGKRASVAVTRLGKIKTAVQMLALIVLLYCEKNTADFLVLSGYILLYFAALLTLWSMLIYLKVVWQHLMMTSNGNNL